MLKALKKELQKNKDQAQAKQLLRYFKTAKGQYGYGDIFLGIKVPLLRKIAASFAQLSLEDTLKLLKSCLHEERMVALLLLMRRYRQADARTKEKIYRAYLKNTRYINNWDLVDLSAKHIVGDFLSSRDRSILYRLASSELVWDRRIAVVSCFYFIGRSDFKDGLKLAQLLIRDKHDLIQKACGWMLREIAKKDKASVETFLKKNRLCIPRVMLRYAIEKFPPAERRMYLEAAKQN